MATFGRRANPQSPRATVRVAAPAQSVTPVEASAEISLPVLSAETASTDHDLQEWKRARGINIPWRQLSLMASLCFGIASFVLPASVNNNVEWLLLGLMAASFYAGFSKRRRKTSG